ncbi:AraC-like DNA-binding protein [Paenibacillus barcinonensis]|nr:AraC family transcriptional regulator [Paenibacillus barcinonensis]PYE47270.1 AraC-like DNA-binding protein [Paenibacillus barcinonensis]
MNIQINCIFNQIIYPNSTVDFSCFENGYMLLENIGSVEIITTNERVSLNNEIILVGNKFKLNNCSSKKSVEIRGITFSNLKRSIRNAPNIISIKDEYQVQLAKRTLNLPKGSQNLEQIYKDLGSLLSLNFSKCTQFLSTQFIDSRLIKINRYIRKYYWKPITLDFLAEMIGCTPVYLSNTYSKVFKVPPIRHLQMIRMKKAAMLLAETDLVIKEIAKNLGYISSSQFSVIFKRYYLYTPLEFRILNISKQKTIEEEKR